MNNVKYERLYALGKYDACVEEIKDLLVEIREGNDISKVIIASRLAAFTVDFDSHILALTLEGNADVAKNAILLRSSAQESEWLDSSSVGFYMKIKTLTSSSNVIPFSIYLNSLYNSLWLLWARGTFYDEDRDTVYDMLDDCLRRVLLNSDVQAKRLSDEARSEIILALLCQVAKNVTKFEIIQCLQITEICILCLHLFLDFKIPDSENYKLLIFILKDSWPQIKTKYAKSMTENITKSEAKTIKLFKFGFFDINETTDYDIERVYEFLCITGCLSLFGLGYLKESADFLTSHLSDSCCKFMCKYIQAYVFLQLQELDVSYLYICRLSHIQMSECAEMQFHLLSGQHACSSGNTISAHLEFTKILPSKQFLYVGLLHILNNLIAAVHTLYEDDGGASALIDKFIQVLRCFYTFITNVSFSEKNNKYDPESKLLSILHKRKSYKMEDVIYVIGKEMLWIKVHHLSSDNSVNTAGIAAKCYMDVLCAYYQQDPSLQTLNTQSWIMHEAVVALILSGKFDEAEVTCQILTQNCTVLKEIVREEPQEVFLMDSGVTALMLMAFIKVYQRKYEDAHNFLTRIKKILVQVYYSHLKPNNNTNISLLNAVIAKVYVLKAILFMKAECKFDAFESCKKALIHNPG